MAEKPNSNHWTDKLLELNKKKNLKYSEIYEVMTDLEIYCKVGKEEVNRLKTEIEKKEIEYKYKLEHLETLRERDKLLDNCRDKSEELIKYKRLTNNLKNDIYELEKQKWLEREKQADIEERKWKKACEEQMKLLENNPSVIKLNDLRRKKAQLIFKIAVRKQKIGELQKQHVQFNKIQKQIQQRNIIKFAEAMVKYYKNEKDKNEVNERNKIQEFKVPTTRVETSQLNINRLTNDKTNTKKNIETMEWNIKSLQLPSLSLLNHNFDIKKYTSTISKPEMNKETSKTNISDITVPKINFVSTISKIQINKLINSEQGNKITQNKQQEQKKIPEPVKLKSKNNDISILESNKVNEKQENKNSSHVATSPKSVVPATKKINLSQNDEKEINQNIKSVKQTKQTSSPAIGQNKTQTFNYPSVKQNIGVVPKPALSQLFNFPSVTKIVENTSQKQVPNQMNLPMEIIQETPQISKPTKQLETKSPYFPTQSSSQNDQSSANTSSDQIVNVSSDQHPSQISGAESNPSNDVEMQEELQPELMEYTDADPNIMEYFEENASVTREDQFSLLSVFTSPPEFAERDLGAQNSNIPQPGTNSLFSANQNTNSNSFFNFGQSNNSKPGNIFNLF